METRSPSAGRVLIAAAFALSCFALFLYLWISFGGPTPLRATGYRITADFPEATTLAPQADVRVGGVTVGRVSSVSLAPYAEGEPDATRAEIEIDPAFAPVSADARAILRTKTLVGETYIELTPGSARTPVALGADSAATPSERATTATIPEGGHLPDARVEPTSQIDDVFNALDPQTRADLQSWQANAAEAVRGRGLDLNSALGNLDPFLFNADRVLAALDAERPALRSLVRDGGTVFGALGAHGRALTGLVENGNRAFAAVASQDDALRQAVQILPTFEREARATLQRLERSRPAAEALADALAPVAPDVAPTLRSVRRLSPPFQRLLRNLSPFIDASQRGLPALAATLKELRPTLVALDPYLANANPVARVLLDYRHSLTDLLGGPPSGTADTLPKLEGQPAPRHILRQYAYLSNEILGIYPHRLDTNRGNGYPQPRSLSDSTANGAGIFASFDCKNTDFTATSTPTDENPVSLYSDPPPDVNGGRPADVGFAPCLIAPNWSRWGLGDGRAPVVRADP